MNRHKGYKMIIIGLLYLIGVVFVLGKGNVGVPTPRSEAKGVLWAGVDLSPGYLQEAMPGHTVIYTHILTNTGTVTDVFSLVAASSQNWTVTLFDETHPSTLLLPVQLGAGLTATVGVSVTVPITVLSGTVAYTTITATSSTSDTVQAVVTDVTAVRRLSGVALSSGQSKEGVSGGVVTFTHTITNTGPITDVFALEARSQQGWAVELLEGVHQTRTLQLPLQLGELGTADFVVSATIPGHIPDNTAEHIVVTATSLVNDVVMSTVTDTITVRATRTYTVFLPLVRRQGPPLAKLGVDFSVIVTDPDLVEYDFPLAKEMGANWVRVLLPWLKIEEAPRQYNWYKYDAVFDRLEQLGFSALVVVYGAPGWAAEEGCGPISDTLALENFLDLAVSRYANVTDAWEFINEPDGQVPHQYGSMIGCWGLYPVEYAQQLGIFHSKVRALDPEAFVFFGSLAYDNWLHFERGFFEATLQNGAGAFFDGVGFHYYPINPDEFPTMAHKAQEIRDTMFRNGVYDKLIWVTETSMWVNWFPPLSSGGLEAQRNFIVQEQSRGFGAGVDNIIWFAVREEPWEQPLHRWLINLDHEPDNGYYTFQHFARQIEDLSCAGAYQGVPPGIEAYKFIGSERLVYVLWSNTITETVSIPSSGDAILTSRDGDELGILPVQMGEVTFEVGTQPVFVEIPEEH